jgi:fatty-acyl-CoA synthase
MTTNWADKRARLTPHRPAIIDGDRDRVYTYGEMSERAHRLAALLQRGDPEPPRVAILAPNGVVHVDLWLAAGVSGLTTVPLNWRLTASELVQLARLAKPTWLLYAPSFQSLADAVVTHIPTVRLLPLGPDAHEYEDRLQAVAPLKGGAVDPERPAMLLFTGGSTGVPKAVRIPHRQIYVNAVNTIVSWDLSAHDRAPVLTPFFHTGGYHVLMTPLYLAGGTSVVFSGFDPERTLAAIPRYGLTVLFMVPTMLKSLLSQPTLGDTDWSTVRFVITGGAPCPPSLADTLRRLNVPYRQGYGLTEVGPNCFAVPDEVTCPPDAIGVPVWNLDAVIVDDTGTPCPDGTPGELWLRGPTVSAGYDQAPDDTARTFDAEGFCHTGDLAVRDPNGFYRIVGRKKDLLISGGENVYPLEIERVLEAHPAVAEAAVIGVPDPHWGEVPAAVIVPTPGHPWDWEALHRYVAVHLARYKRPKYWQVVEALPLTSAGKVDKRALVRNFTPDDTQAPHGAKS